MVNVYLLDSSVYERDNKPELRRKMAPKNKGTLVSVSEEWGERGGEGWFFISSMDIPRAPNLSLSLLQGLVLDALSACCFVSLEPRETVYCAIAVLRSSSCVFVSSVPSYNWETRTDSSKFCASWVHASSSSGVLRNVPLKDLSSGSCRPISLMTCEKRGSTPSEGALLPTVRIEKDHMI